MSNETIDVQSSWKAVIILFVFFSILIGGIFTFSGHYEKLSCSDHKDAGFNTVLKGDWFIPKCFVELNSTGNMIPLGRYMSVAEYKQLA